MNLTGKIITGIVVVIVAIQFYRPDRDNPPETAAATIYAAMEVPTPVHDILERSCIDCHSSRTAWPWYTQVSPVSWFVADHVVEGRDELNLSDWQRYTPRRSEHKLEELCEHVEEGEMPLASYLLIHRESKLSNADVETLCSWTKQTRNMLRTQYPEAFLAEGAETADAAEATEAEHDEDSE